MKNIFLVIIIAVFAMNGFAQSACESIQGEIEHQIKNVAASYASGIGDRSVPRLSLRNLEIAVHLQLIEINLKLLEQNKCPPRTTPIAWGAYLLEALECENAKIGGKADIPECDLKKWTGRTSKKED